jgi:hypothetical protein
MQGYRDRCRNHFCQIELFKVAWFFNRAVDKQYLSIALTQKVDGRRTPVDE